MNQLGIRAGPRAARRFMRLSRLKRTVFFLIVLLVGTFSWAFMREARLVSGQKVNSWSEDVSADCAVALTGGPNRIREGLDLLSRHSVKKLIISGVYPQAQLRDFFPQLPYYGDLDEQDVVLERRSRTTYGNAQQTLPLVEALRCRDLVVITSRAHMYRALKTFRAEFPPDFPIIARAVVAGSETPAIDELGWETLKSLFYASWAY